MMRRSSGSTLSLDILAQHIHQATALQFFSDGGFTEGLGGAYGVQLLAHAGHERIVVGYLYKFSAQATSAFEMELKGLEAAVGILCHGNPSRGANLHQIVPSWAFTCVFPIHMHMRALTILIIQIEYF